MKTTKLYYKLLLLLPFFFSLSSLASDSLKVKKIEYYEDEKLVRATFFDNLGNNLKDFYFDFCDNFEAKLQNQTEIRTYEKNKIISSKTYHFKVDDNTIFFNKGTYIGNVQRAKYNSSGQILENNAELMFFKENYLERICSLDSLEFIPIKYESGFKIRIVYDHLGNKIEKKYIDSQNSGDKTLYKYDSLNKMIGWADFDKSQKSIGKLTYYNNCIEKNVETFEGRKMINNTIWKFWKNEKKQDFKTEKYEVPLKKSKPIGEPKLTFTQENIYENGRIVKIIYEDLQLGKKKIHELKYEFY